MRIESLAEKIADGTVHVIGIGLGIAATTASDHGFFGERLKPEEPSVSWSMQPAS